MSNSDIPADERKRLLRQSVTDEVVFTGPKEDDQGFDKLVEHIEQFQKKSPGAYFENNNLLTQHGQLLSEWTLYKKDGARSQPVTRMRDSMSKGVLPIWPDFSRSRATRADEPDGEARGDVEQGERAAGG
jgi:hypothetical protein